jgi:hypothetical protein
VLCCGVLTHSSCWQHLIPHFHSFSVQHWLVQGFSHDGSCGGGLCTCTHPVHVNVGSYLSWLQERIDMGTQASCTGCTTHHPLCSGRYNIARWERIPLQSRQLDSLAVDYVTAFLLLRVIFVTIQIRPGIARDALGSCIRFAHRQAKHRRTIEACSVRTARV